MGLERIMKGWMASNYVIKTELVEATRIPEVDDALYSLVNILSLGAGESLRSIFLIGSYVNGSYTADSDVDLCLVLKDGAVEPMRRRVASLAAHVSRTQRLVFDPMYNGTEAPLYDSAKFTDDSWGANGYPCGPVLKLAIRSHSLLMWGEDIRSRIALSGPQEMLADVLAPSLIRIRQERNLPPDSKIPFPLSDPAPGKADMGYGDLKRVSALVLHIARAMVFLRTGEFLFDKRQIPDAFAKHIGEPWIGLVREIARARQGNLSQSESKDLHQYACKNMVAFEACFLEKAGMTV